MARRLLVSLSGVAAAAILVLAQGSLSAAEAAAPPAGSSGHDISWPQCGAPYPSDGGFGIVGVTDGRAWSANPCLASEYAWAASYPRTPDLYMNTANPAPQSSHYWPASGSSDPALCRNATVTTDPGCAYDYGWHTAADALATSRSALGAAAQGTWWLDVETTNTWNGDSTSNAADVQGSIDYLLAQHVAGVGVYSTSYQWNVITGGYSTTNAATYASAWRSEFTSPNGIGGSPSWVAGASGPSDAPSRCGSSFLGTTTWLVQYIANSFDVDYACSTQPATPGYSVGVPAAVSAGLGATVSTTVTVAATAGWQGSVALSVKAPASISAVLGSSTVSLAANGTAKVTLSLRSGTAGTYSVIVTAAPAQGSSTTTAHTATLSFTVTRKARHIDS